MLTMSVSRACDPQEEPPLYYYLSHSFALLWFSNTDIVSFATFAGASLGFGKWYIITLATFLFVLVAMIPAMFPGYLIRALFLIITLSLLSAGLMVYQRGHFDHVA